MNSQNKMTKWKRQYRKKWKHVLYIIPILIIWFIFAIYPRIEVFPMSLYEWNPVTNRKIYKGFYYFKLMFTRNLKYTMRDIKNTCYYVAFLLVIQSVLAMILTLALRRDTKVNRFFRAFFFMPMVFSSAMVALTWSYMYDPNLGVINNILAMFSDKFPGFSFFDKDWMAILVVVIVHIWANIGYTIMILNSGLTTISDELAEAAKVDGATTWQSFWKIEFPLMLPTFLRMILMTISTGAMACEYQYLLGNKADVMTYDTLGTQLYKSLSSATNYGPVCAVSVCVFFILGGITLFQYIVMNKVENRILG